ncbi:MAG: dodecin family protein [Promethearchaeota archaeon]
MPEESVYKYIELTGVSAKSWEQAINNAITKAAQSLRDLRVAEVITQDVRIENNKIVEYRVRLKLSFKYEKE